MILRRTSVAGRDAAPAARPAVLLAFAGLITLCTVFLIADIEVPTWAILLGRWIPALASLTALLALGRRQIAITWRLRPTSTAGIGKAYGLALAVMIPVLVLPVLAAVGVGAEVVSTGTLLMALPLLLFGPLIFGISTLGEEVLWRGHLTTVLHRRGFWPMALGIGVIWMTWHIPLHALMWHQGNLSATEAVVSTVGILIWSPLLSAMAVRAGTVWPAVFAHAVPASALNLISETSRGDSVVFWTTTVTSWLLMIFGAAVIARGQRSPESPPRAVVNPPSTAIA